MGFGEWFIAERSSRPRSLLMRMLGRSTSSYYKRLLKTRQVAYGHSRPTSVNSHIVTMLWIVDAGAEERSAGPLRPWTGGVREKTLLDTWTRYPALTRLLPHLFMSARGVHQAALQGPSGTGKHHLNNTHNGTGRRSSRVQNGSGTCDMDPRPRCCCLALHVVVPGQGEQVLLEPWNSLKDVAV
jgi:hypothetical protein